MLVSGAMSVLVQSQSVDGDVGHEGGQEGEGEVANFDPPLLDRVVLTSGAIFAHTATTTTTSSSSSSSSSSSHAVTMQQGCPLLGVTRAVAIADSTGRQDQQAWGLRAYSRVDEGNGEGEGDGGGGGGGGGGGAVLVEVMLNWAPTSALRCSTSDTSEVCRL